MKKVTLLAVLLVMAVPTTAVSSPIIVPPAPRNADGSGECSLTMVFDGWIGCLPTWHVEPVCQ